MTQILLLIHVVISCALQKGWHTRMYLASVPPCVFGGQGIAYNVPQLHEGRDFKNENLILCNKLYLKTRI